jgi:hypothetical protein
VVDEEQKSAGAGFDGREGGAVGRAAVEGDGAAETVADEWLAFALIASAPIQASDAGRGENTLKRNVSLTLRGVPASL